MPIDPLLNRIDSHYQPCDESMTYIQDISDPNIETPEKSLMLAMLIRALLDALGNDSLAKGKRNGEYANKECSYWRERNKKDSLKWIFWKEQWPTQPIVSIYQVCEYLNLDVEMIRGKIRQYTSPSNKQEIPSLRRLKATSKKPLKRGSDTNASLV